LRLLSKNERQAGVAQLVEQLICNHQVGGSNPFTGSNKFNELEHLSGCFFFCHTRIHTQYFGQRQKVKPLGTEK
jgi:hypothetical protein